MINLSICQCETLYHKQITLAESCSGVKITPVSCCFFKLGLRLFLGGGARPCVKELSIAEFLFTKENASSFFEFSTSS